MIDPTPTPLDLDAASEVIERMADQVISTAGMILLDVSDAVTYQRARRRAGADVETARALVAEVRRLRAVIKDTPHGPHCKPWREEHWPDDPQICVCGKRDALAGVTP